MLAEQGAIKVLDFGLAKLTEVTNNENSATRTLAPTRHGRRISVEYDRLIVRSPGKPPDHPRIASLNAVQQ